MLQSPRKLLSGAKSLRGTGAFGLTEHQLMLADLFKSSKPILPEGEPKNIEVLQHLSKPLARHKVAKFVEEEEKAREESKKQIKPHELGEPKNLEFLTHLARPSPRLAVKKFVDELAEEKKRPKGAKELPEPKNLERLQEMSKPLRKTKKFDDIIAEEEALQAKKGNAKFDPTVKKVFKKKQPKPVTKKKAPTETAPTPAAASAPAATEEASDASAPAAAAAPAQSNDAPAGGDAAAPSTTTEQTATGSESSESTNATPAASTEQAATSETPATEATNEAEQTQTNA